MIACSVWSSTMKMILSMVLLESMTGYHGGVDDEFPPAGNGAVGDIEGLAGLFLVPAAFIQFPEFAFREQQAR